MRTLSPPRRRVSRPEERFSHEQSSAIELETLNENEQGLRDLAEMGFPDTKLNAKLPAVASVVEEVKALGNGQCTAGQSAAPTISARSKGINLVAKVTVHQDYETIPQIIMAPTSKT